MAFGGILKQSTAIDVLIGPFIDDTDGKTAETGLTLAQADIKLSKNGQTLAQKNDVTSATHDSDGYYNCELDATDTNTVGQLTLIVHESGALPIRLDFQVVEENTYDALYASGQSAFDASQRVDVGSVGGTAQTANDNGADINAILVDTNEMQGKLPTNYIMGSSDVNNHDTDIDAILTDTNELQTDWANGGRLDLILDELTTQGDTNEGKLDTIDGVVDGILLDTAEIGVAGAGLTALPWNAAWDAEVQSECADALIAYDPPTKAEMDSGFSGLNDLSAADVNAQVLDVLNTDTFAEPGQEAPAATTTLVNKISYLYKFLRNKITNDGSYVTVYADDETTTDQKAVIDNTGGTVTRGEFGSGV